MEGHEKQRVMQSSQHVVLVAAEMVIGLEEVGENEFKEKGKLKIYFHLLILNSCYFVLLMGENEYKEKKSEPSSTFLTNIFNCCDFFCHLGLYYFVLNYVIIEGHTQCTNLSFCGV